jgi:hypothetical protein
VRKQIIVTTLLVLLSTAAMAGNWWETIKLKGDLRYRHEMLKTGENNARNRQRVRARLGIQGKVSDMTTVHLQLATGSTDPVSTNQTLGDGFSTKSIMLDKAYLEIKPDFAPGLDVRAGKFSTPFFKPGESELLWDSDLNPEGGVATWKGGGKDVKLELIGSGLWIEERSSQKNSWMAAGQAVLEYETPDGKGGFAVGSGLFDYVNTVGFEPFYNGEPMGNTVDALGHYVDKYQLLELFAEASHHINEIPVVVMGDYVNNTGADSLNQGWLAGIRIGKTKKPGSWNFRYIYREVKKDAVIGTFTDSDFRGGGTDAKGHEIGGGVQLASNTTFNVSYFINKLGLEGPEIDFKRLQVDLQLKF